MIFCYLNHDGGLELCLGILGGLQYLACYSDAPKSPEDMKFDQIIMEMQQIVIDPHFENTLTNFMSQHWGTLDHPQQAQQIQLFQNYQQTIQQYLHTVFR